MTTITRNDKIRENRQGAPIETVLYAHDCVVETYEGNRYHPTKVVRVD